MRLAVLSDIHGNLPAFEAALRDVRAQSPDEILLIGDIVNGAPDSADCWALAQSLGCPMLRGNHERYVAHFGTAEAAPAWTTEQFAPLHWTVAQFSESERQQMGELPLLLRLPDVPETVFVHASPRDDGDTVASHTAEDDLTAMFASVEEPWIIRGHNHIGQVRLWDGRVIVTNSAVGLPLDANTTAQYLLLDSHANGWRVRHQSVPYDLDRVLTRFHTTGCLAQTGPMGRLFYREFATATPHLIPFFRAYAAWSKIAPLTLSEAVDRFLSF